VPPGSVLLHGARRASPPGSGMCRHGESRRRCLGGVRGCGCRGGRVCRPGDSLGTGGPLTRSHVGSVVAWRSTRFRFRGPVRRRDLVDLWARPHGPRGHVALRTARRAGQPWALDVEGGTASATCQLVRRTRQLRPQSRRGCPARRTTPTRAIRTRALDLSGVHHQHYVALTRGRDSASVPLT
jgi:hypothetical protein